MQKSSKKPEAAPPVDVDDSMRTEQLEKLRALLERVRSQPGMGPVARALSSMLNAGQVVCEWVRCNGNYELVLAARVTRDDIRALLPLARHPVPYALLRYFLERMIYIVRLTGNETELMFCNAEAFTSTPDPLVARCVYRSGVPDPVGLEDAAKQAAAEMVVADYLGAPFQPNPDGWVQLYIGGESVEIRCVDADAKDLSCPLPEALRHDVLVFVATKRAHAPVELLGWVDRVRLSEACRAPIAAEAGLGVLRLDALLPMELLKERAQAGGCWIQ